MVYYENFTNNLHLLLGLKIVLHSLKPSQKNIYIYIWKSLYHWDGNPYTNKKNSDTRIGSLEEANANVLAFLAQVVKL